MTPCFSHNFPPMYLKRNTTRRLLNLRTLLCMQLLTHETVFEYIVWPIRRTVRRVHCKKRHKFTQRFDLQGHARVQIFTYKNVSVCISLTWSPRMHTNVQLKTRSHTCVHVFITNTYLYTSFVIWDSCLYYVLSHYFDRKECFYTTFDIQGRVSCVKSYACTCLSNSKSVQT